MCDCSSKTMETGFTLESSTVQHLATTAGLSNETRLSVWNTTRLSSWNKPIVPGLNEITESAWNKSHVWPSPGTMNEFANGTGHANASFIILPENMLELLNRSKAISLLPVLIYVGILMITGIVGNSCVIYIFRYRFRRSASNYFVVCLAVLDLITCLFSMPFEILDLARPYTFSTAWACKTMRFVSSVSVMASVFVLMGVAVDRYFKAMRPFSPITVKRTKIVCVISFAVSIAFSWPAVFIFGIKTVPDIIPGLSGTECSTADAMKGRPYPMIYSAILFLFYFICVIVMMVLYGRLNREINKRRHRKPVTSPSILPAERSTTESSISPGTPVRDLPLSANIDTNIQTQGPSLTKPTAAWEVMESLLRSSTAACAAEQTCISHSHDNSGTQEEIALSKPAAAWRVTDALIRNSTIENPDEINPRKTLRSTSVQFVKSDDNCHMVYRDFTEETPKLETVNSTEASMTLRKRFTLKVNLRKFQMTRTTCVLLSVSLAFIFSFLPYVVVKSLQAAISSFDMNKTALKSVIYNLCVRSFFVSNAINPFIYGYLNPHFRTELLRLIGKCLPYCATCAEERRAQRVMSTTDSSHDRSECD